MNEMYEYQGMKYTEEEAFSKKWEQIVIGKGNNGPAPAEVDCFARLPKQAQGLLLQYLTHTFECGPLTSSSERELNRILALGCNSPIEYTYAVALILDYSFRFSDLWKENDKDFIKTAGFEMFPQYEIVANGKTYFADFLLSVDYQGDLIDGGQQWQEIVVECDGFEYHHATKEQVNHDNERELAIKKAGYDVLRFSGSQIYNDPFKCADDTIDYIIAEMNRRCIAEGTDG